jgi:mannose-1-phosphate guanylyltransferase
LLERWLGALRAAGVERVRINTHWLATAVDEWVASYHAEPMTVETVFEPVLLGSAGTLIANRDWIREADRLLIVYADNFSNTDLGALLVEHDRHDSPLTIGVFHAANPERCGIVEVADDGRVLSFIEKPSRPASDLAAGGLYVMDTALLDRFPAVRAGFTLDLGLDVLPAIATLGRAVMLGDIHLDIGTVESYELAKRIAGGEER